MANKGYFTTTGYDGRHLRFDWEIVSQSIVDNTTTISYSLKGAGTGITAIWYMAGAFKLKINGTTVYSSGTGWNDRIQLYDGTVLHTGTLTINHNSDGTKSFTAYAEGAIYNFDVNCSGSGSWDLDPIPRAVRVSSAPDFTDMDNPTITYTVPYADMVESLQACISLTGDRPDIAYRDIRLSDTSYTFELTEAERTLLRNATVGSVSREVRFYIKTVIEGETYYHNKPVTFTVVDCFPTIDATVEDSNPSTLALTGNSRYFVKGYSHADYAITAQAFKGATISSYRAVCGSEGSTEQSGTIYTVESALFKFSVTDTRNQTATKNIACTLIDYSPVTCNMQTTSPNAEGELTLTVDGRYWTGSFGAKDNALTVQYKYREGSGEWSDWVGGTATVNEDGTYRARILVTGLDYKTTITLQARAMDELSIAESAEAKVNTSPLFHWGETDFVFNVDVEMKDNCHIEGNLTLGSGMLRTYTMLFNSSSGTTSNVSLKDSAENYDYLEIYYTDNNGKQMQSVTVYKPNGKQVTLANMEPQIVNDSSGNFVASVIHYRTSLWYINGAAINYSGTSTFQSIRSNGSHTYATTQYNKIVRVVGIKEV